MTADPRPTRVRDPRLRVLAVFAAVLIVAGVLDRRASDSSVARAAEAGVLGAGPIVPARDAFSTAWYCAEGTSNPGGRADETIVIGNLGTRAADSLVTVLPGGNAPAASKRVPLPARSQVRVAVSEIAAVPEPGVIVEVFGTQSLVEHVVRSGDDIALDACARQPAAGWYFAGGTTVKGSQEWLALFNPLESDATVDVTVFTDNGLQRPEQLQGVAVPRRTRVSQPIHDLVRREQVVAMAVRARTGRVVAETSQYFDGTEERTDPADVNRRLPPRNGIGMTLGAPAPAAEWDFPVFEHRGGVSAAVDVANPAGVPAEAEILTFLDGAATLAPQTVQIPPRSAVRVDPGARVADGTNYAVSVRSTTDVDVVAGSLTSWTSPDPSAAIETLLGSTRHATDWAFALGRIDDARASTVTVLDDGTRAVSVSVGVVTGGKVRYPAATRSITIPPGRRATVDSAALGATTDSMLVVHSTGPVVAAIDLPFGRGRTVSAGVPFARGDAGARLGAPRLVSPTTTRPTTTGPTAASSTTAASTTGVSTTAGSSTTAASTAGVSTTAASSSTGR
ncbi:MAG: DUF5719 family protein [Acidimicrobiia bacterium]